jgi:hypothetical protein
MGQTRGLSLAILAHFMSTHSVGSPGNNSDPGKANASPNAIRPSSGIPSGKETFSAQDIHPRQYVYQ